LCQNTSGVVCLQSLSMSQNAGLGETAIAIVLNLLFTSPYLKIRILMLWRRSPQVSMYEMVKNLLRYSNITIYLVGGVEHIHFLSGWPWC